MAHWRVTTSDVDAWQNEIAEYLEALEAELRSVTCITHPRYAEFFNMFHYHLGWTDTRGNAVRADTGKRLRPLICLWVCEAAGGAWRDALPAAAAIELVHNFSLIHDDIQDQSVARRGRPTVWHVWGLAQGINAGDGMFALAHLALDRLRKLSLEPYTEIHHTFDRATLRLTQGQFLDLAYERADQITLDEYLEMVRGKTAALLSAACEIGARIALAEPSHIAAFASYGENLGIAFQISDDVLGIWGDPARTGKSARSDLTSRKKSYPVLAAMCADASGELRRLYALPEWSAADLAQVEAILTRTDARHQAMQQVQAYARAAREALEGTRLENAVMARLRKVVDWVVRREK